MRFQPFREGSSRRTSLDLEMQHIVHLKYYVPVLNTKKKRYLPFYLSHMFGKLLFTKLTLNNDFLDYLSYSQKS